MCRLNLDLCNLAYSYRVTEAISDRPVQFDDEVA